MDDEKIGDNSREKDTEKQTQTQTPAQRIPELWREGERDEEGSINQRGKWRKPTRGKRRMMGWRGNEMRHDAREANGNGRCEDAGAGK